MFWVAANQFGIFGSLKYVGDSKVVDPGGVFHLRDRRPRQGHRTRRSRHCELEGTTGSCLRTPTSRLRSSAAGRPDCRSAGTSAAKASNTSSSKPKTPVHVWTDTRWDNFTLVTPNWHCRLPGYSYAGSDPDGFKKRDEVVEWLNGWLDTFGPLRAHTRVTRLRHAIDGGFELTLVSDGHDEVITDVVIATGQSGAQVAEDRDLAGRLYEYRDQGISGRTSRPREDQPLRHRPRRSPRHRSARVRAPGR